MDKKFFGLILPNKSKKCQPKLKSIFDSDEDESESSTAAKKPNVSGFASSKLSVKNKLLQKKLAEEDPTIYEYDSVYDTLKQNQTENQTSAKREGPKYINSLLKAAEKRKNEQERRQEKKIQNEREKEGDEFKDKEAFVTSAYKQKMLEMQEEEEREKLLDQIDDMMDVTKQKDLSGFYRHHLNQTVGEEAVPEFGARDAKVKELIKQALEKDSSSLKTRDNAKEDAKPHSAQYYENLDADSYSSSGEDIKDDDKPKSSEKQLQSKSRSSLSSDDGVKGESHSKYRQKMTDNLDNSRKFKSSNEEKSYHRHKATHSKSNIDKNLSDSSSEKKKKLCSESAGKSHSDHKRKHTNVDSPTMPDEASNEDSQLSNHEDTSRNNVSENRVKTSSKPDITVKFAKRTVGEVFDLAQARYFKRMATRKIG